MSLIINCCRHLFTKPGASILIHFSYLNERFNLRNVKKFLCKNIKWLIKTEINHLGGWSRMIKFQVSLIYIVNPNQPGGLHSKRLPLNRQSGRTKNHQKSTVVASWSYIPFANSLHFMVMWHLYLNQVFTSRNIFFQAQSIQLSGRQAPPGGRQGILHYNFLFWDPRFSAIV